MYFYSGVFLRDVLRGLAESGLRGQARTSGARRPDFMIQRKSLSNPTDARRQFGRLETSPRGPAKRREPPATESRPADCDAQAQTADPRPVSIL